MNLNLQPNQNSTQKLNINLSNADNVYCESCQNNTFVPVFMFKKVSKFEIGETQDVVIPAQVFACADCGTLLQDTIPESFK